MTLQDRVLLHEETARRLVLIERCSSLPTEDFCRAILVVATNDPVLRAALNRSTLTTGKPDITKPEKPIEP